MIKTNPGSDTFKEKLFAMIDSSHSHSSLTASQRAEQIIDVAIEIMDRRGSIADRKNAIEQCHQLVDKCGGLSGAGSSQSLRKVA